MHNSKRVEDFIDKINKEAEEAAQKVFDKYENHFRSLVESEMKKNDKLILSMGSSYYENTNQENITEAGRKFLDVIAHIQYMQQRASFNTMEFSRQK